MAASYCEHPSPPDLSALVACTWTCRTDVVHAQRVVPDGCVDLIWLEPGQLIVAGADTGPRGVELPLGARLSGIRLRPGAAGAVLGVPAGELRDRDVALAAIWGAHGTRIVETMDAAEPADRPALLAAAVAGRGAEPDPLVVAAAARLSVISARVAGVASDLGVSERHLHRRTIQAVGYGPKMLARVARLRRLVGLADPRLAIRAQAAGYSSQSHMAEEVRRLTGTSPRLFLRDAALTAA